MKIERTLSQSAQLGTRVGTGNLLKKVDHQVAQAMVKLGLDKAIKGMNGLSPSAVADCAEQ